MVVACALDRIVLRRCAANEMLVPETTLAETIGMVPFFEGW